MYMNLYIEDEPHVFKLCSVLFLFQCILGVYENLPDSPSTFTLD